MLLEETLTDPSSLTRRRRCSTGWPTISSRIAYVTTGFPFVSHTFIADEVRALRELGLEIDTFAVRRARPEHVLSAADRQALATTYAIRPPRVRDFLGAHLRGLTRVSDSYLRALREALARGGASPRDLVWQAFYFAQAAVLWDQCSERGVRHIHAHFANVSSDLAMLAVSIGGGASRGWTWSFTMHGPTEFADVTRFRLRAKVQAATFVVCISDYCRSQLMALSKPAEWPKLKIVHCGVDTTRFRARAKEPASDGGIDVLCVGRLVPEKGQPVLLEAVAELCKRDVDARLTLVGDGPEAASLRSRAAAEGISDRVRFLGAVEHPEVIRQLERTDIFCLASLAEGVPIVLMEAMAMEVPVVATRITGVPELVEDGVSGVVVAPGRSADLAAAIESLAADPSLRLRLGKAGRARVAQAYELHTSARGLLEIFGATSSGAP